MTLPDTKIAVALDDDDDADYEAISWTHPMERVIFSRAPREDSLGSKYNRAQALVKADLFIEFADDMSMPDIGWDTKLEAAAATLPDKCGIVLFGEIPGVLQPGIAMTAKFVEAMGFFNAPYFPFWWGGDTWPLEIATMAGCYVHANVRVELLGEVKGKSRGVQEISFWGRFFDTTRHSRRLIAENLIREIPRPENVKAQLLTSLDEQERRWLESNKPCSDPANAKRLEAHYGFDNEPTPRYLRLKAQAEKMMEELAP